MATRARIFEEPVIDTSEFQPKTDADARPGISEIDRMSGDKYRSREAVPLLPTAIQQSTASQQSTVGHQSTKRMPMVYRTGRNVTFSAKTTQATVDAFYELAQAQGWKAGETFEKAVEALRCQVKDN